MKPNDLKVVGCRLITGTARHIEFTLSDGQTIRVVDRAEIEAIVAGSDSDAPIDGAVAALRLTHRQPEESNRGAG